MEIDEKPRRDFLFLATGAFAAVGGVAFSSRIFAPLKPAPYKKQSEFLIDLTAIEEGQQLKLLYQGKPVAVRHRTQAEIEKARRDDQAVLPHAETDESRLRPKADGTYDPRFLVLYLICPHFSCVPVADAGDFDGWYCPCHGAHFDTSGRVRKGPPPVNMKIPDYEWISDTVINLRELSAFERYEASQL